MKTKTNAELALELGRSMAELRAYLRQFIQVKLKEQGINLTFEMLEVLGVLWQKDGVNQQEIADLTLRDKSSMTYLLDNLVKRKMVRRVEDENDRRSKLVFLTKEGFGLKEQLNPWLAEIYEIASQQLEAPDFEKCTILLNKMVSNLRNR